ncbi:unnamed protein product [Bursaphelenchus xylophilus]|uniref:(pine wood nematode) hypothetical protein n=1 Tax=Bursaphelenchus xylophilus TaxID=6326 RepID=A0A1I7RRZ4_BURXY|nr:unnamed protein product [Bursaphelenchus xylophilus]CAG9123366.1 unnamed protein product [Bursaphelenchus xylophilus]
MAKTLDKNLHESIIPTIEVKLQGIENGLGFNIVGGVDTPHIPGHDGFFISRIRPNSAAADNGRLNVGDRIVAVNGTIITPLTHDQAVQIFKSASKECVLTVEPDAERILLSQPSDLIVRSSSSTNQTPLSGSKSDNSSRSSSPSSAKNKGNSKKTNFIVKENNKKLQAEVVREEIESLAAKENGMQNQAEVERKENCVNVTEDVKKREEELERGEDGNNQNNLSKGNSEVISNGTVPNKKQGNLQNVVPPCKVNDDEEDRASTVSMAPSIAHSVIDDIPRTPKKPTSILDPSNPSILTEVLFVSIGVVALGAGIVLSYRYLRRH